MPRPRKVATPGESASTESNIDAAIDAAQQGQTHKISKHPDPATLPKSPVKGDPTRRQSATVNAKTEMSYDEAMKLLGEGKLTRSVLTEKGWIAVPRAIPAQAKV